MGTRPTGVSSWETSMLPQLAVSDSRLDTHRVEKSKPTLYNGQRRKHYMAVCRKLTGLGREALCCLTAVWFVA